MMNISSDNDHKSNIKINVDLDQQFKAALTWILKTQDQQLC